MKEVYNILGIRNSRDIYLKLKPYMKKDGVVAGNAGSYRTGALSCYNAV